MTRVQATVLASALLLVCLPVLLVACGSKPPEYLSEDAKKGWVAYHRHCTICHNPDPFQEGTTSPGGPPIAGSSEELVRLRVEKQKYPKGYKPKADTNLMTPVPQAIPDIPFLAAYLKEVRKPQ